MLAAIDSTIGKDYREVLTEIDGLRTTLTELGARLRATRAEVPELAERLGGLAARSANDATA